MSEKIEIIRAEDYLVKKVIQHIDFIKIDIEGRELRILKGFGSYFNGEFINFIQFEYGGTNIDSKTSLLDFYSLL